MGNGIAWYTIRHTDGILEEIMNFFEWYGIGLVILLILFAQQAYRDFRSVKKTAFDLYDTFIRRGDVLSTTVILVTALLGPLLLLIIAYFQFIAWRNGLSVDENNNVEYPWRKE